MALTGLTEESRINPLDVVERIASLNDWSFERAGDDWVTAYPKDGATHDGGSRQG